MSVGKLWRDAYWVLTRLLQLLTGWILIVPFVLVIPRRRDWVAVIGKHGGKFIDNGKYFFIQGVPLLTPENRCVFITDRHDTADMLADTGYEVGYYPSWRTTWFLARAGCVVFESAGWSNKLRGFLLINARQIQLWHGVGFKGLTQWGQWSSQEKGNSIGFRVKELCLGGARRLLGNRNYYDIFNTTSKFYKENVFEPVFAAKHFLITGYPRNAFATFSKPLSDIIWKNVDPDVAGGLSCWQARGTRVVIVAPTLRTDGSLPLDLDAALVEKLNRFCARENVVFLFKFHPLSQGVSKISREHIHIIDSNSDLYPVMPACSALVTDYSSIYMDYLLLDRPVHFYMPEQLEQGDGVGAFQFDLDTMMPGPKHLTWDELLTSLLDQWGQDEYVSDRARLRQLAFDDLPQEQSVPKLIRFMQEQHWVRPPQDTALDEVDRAGR